MSQLSQCEKKRHVLLVAFTYLAGIGIIMLGIVIRVGYLQSTAAHRPDGLVVETASQNEVLSRRGALLDRQGRVLATTRIGHRLFADPQLIEDWSTFAVRVAHAIGGDAVEIEKHLTLSANRRYVVLHELLTQQQLEAVSDLELGGLAVEPRPVRVYPEATLLSQVVGFVGRDHTGLDGLEFAHDRLLGGRSGVLEITRDVHRRPLWIEESGLTPPIDGTDIRLSFDIIIQRIAEEELAKVCKKHKADRGEIVVMDARNGQVYAMANWPFFDPARAGERGAEKATRNRCVTDPFEPGSIFKPFVHAAATEARIVGLRRLVDCTEGGYWVTGFGRVLRDAHAHGILDWSEVLIKSSNIGMGKIGQILGPQRMDRSVRAFGFGSPSGIGLPGESNGILTPLRNWTQYTVTSVPMGQEIAVTPVQLVKGFSAFANGGMIVEPNLDADATDQPRLARAVGQSTADKTRQILRRVVTEGTGRNAKSDRYRIWGKTGTAQVPDLRRGGYKHRAYTSSFICGAPLNEPRLVVLVTVHEPNPRTGYYGGVVATPTAKTVVERTLQYLGVAPDVKDHERAPAGIAAAGD